MMRDIEFKSGDGEYVHGVLLEPTERGPRPVVLFVHGLLSTHQEFGDYPDRLCARGYLVLAIDLRGHGQSEGLRGLISQDRMVEDVQHALDFVDAQPGADTKRIALFGHSFGGGAVICTAARDPRATVVVAGATVGRLRDELSANEVLTYRVVNAINRAQKAFTGKSLYVPYRVTYKDIFADPQAGATAQAQGFLQKSLPADNIPLLMQQDAIACASNLRVPVLIIASELDRVVKQSSTRQVYDAIPGEKEWYLIKGSGHSFATDCQKDIAFDKIAAWIDAHLQVGVGMHPGKGDGHA
jgi:uncharacterized protein